MDFPDENLVTGGHGLCAGCGAAIGLRLALLALGKNTVVVNSAGCLTLQPTYPYTPFKVPWIFLAIENAGAVAAGLSAAYRSLGKDVTVLCYIGDGATFDIGLQSLSGACELGENFIYVCYNNQAFMNTGVQRSSATPKCAKTTTTPGGNPFRRKPMIRIMAAHGIPYVATACISYPQDFINKLKKAKSIKGPKYIELLCPCVPGWGYEQSRTVEVGRLAVETGVWPLMEIENGKFRLTYMPKKLRPVKEFLSLQKRFSGVDEKEIEKIVRERWEKLVDGRFWEVDF
ncbi:MAG: pyruvate synthase subunit beta [Candidatus Micrarchaeota archaeon]|nr:pyruvate synthase subunit beta [Candidatus Micrarchaeota archaeon]